MQHEFGFDTELEERFSFIYKKKFLNGLVEHEYDHVFVGMFDGEPVPNPAEIEEYMWVGLEDLKRDMFESPDVYSFWFKLIIKKYSDRL